VEHGAHHDRQAQIEAVAAVTEQAQRERRDAPRVIEADAIRGPERVALAGHAHVLRA